MTGAGRLAGCSALVEWRMMYVALQKYLLPDQYDSMIYSTTYLLSPIVMTYLQTGLTLVPVVLQ